MSSDASAQSTANADFYSREEVRRRIFSIVAASSGKLVEWFDFYYTSVAGIVKAEMFPIQLRALGVGLAYAVANAVFGGTAEYVALGLKSMGHETEFYWYVTVMMVVVFLASLRIPREARFLRTEL